MQAKLANGYQQIVIPASQLAEGVYGPHNTLVPWGSIATLVPLAAELQARAGIEFASSYDDLDDLVVALLQTAGGEHLALVQHLGNPEPETEVHALVDTPADAERLLTDLLAALQLDAAAVAWRRSDSPDARWPPLARAESA